MKTDFSALQKAVYFAWKMDTDYGEAALQEFSQLMQYAANLRIALAARNEQGSDTIGEDLVRTERLLELERLRIEQANRIAELEEKVTELVNLGLDGPIGGGGIRR